MSRLFLGEIAQALVTDPLTGSASGYSLVGASPGLARADAEHLAQQPLVTDYLHLLPEQRSFFAYHPLPSGAWALTRRFLHGKRRGAFNRVVVHALVLPPELLDRLDDPPLALRSDAVLGEDGEPWIRLGDRLIEESVFAGGPLPLPPLAVAAPADLAERRVAALLGQREHLLASWGAERLRAVLTQSFAALARGRLLLDQGPEEEQFLGLVFSLLPWRDRRRLAFTTHLPIEALRLFRLAAIDSPRQVLERLPPGHGAFGLHSPLPSGGSLGAEALTALFFDPDLLAQWLREERSSGASLWDDAEGHAEGLAAGVAELAGRLGRQGLEQALRERLPRPAAPVEAPVDPVAAAAAREAEAADPLRLLEKLLAGPAGREPERLARELLGRLSADPARRLEQGLFLLRSPALSQRAKWLLEGAFLGKLLDGAADALRRSPPALADTASSYGLHAQQLVAGALGRASVGISPPPTEFLSAALRAGRMDLAGDFLRAAGAGYFRGLRRPAHGELIGQLAAAWAKKAHRLDLLPFGEAISRLEERS